MYFFIIYTMGRHNRPIFFIIARYTLLSYRLCTSKIVRGYCSLARAAAMRRAASRMLSSLVA